MSESRSSGSAAFRRQLLDRASNASDFCSVSVDDVEGGRSGRGAPASDQGHTKIALIGGQGISSKCGIGRLGAELASSRHDGAAQLPVDIDAASRCRVRNPSC